jgi:hypothetical protein
MSQRSFISCCIHLLLLLLLLHPPPPLLLDVGKVTARSASNVRILSFDKTIEAEQYRLHEDCAINDWVRHHHMRDSHPHFGCDRRHLAVVNDADKNRSGGHPAADGRTRYADSRRRRHRRRNCLPRPLAGVNAVRGLE